MFKKTISILLSLMLILALPVQALAEEYDLTVGDITITADDSGQYVHQDNYTDSSRTYETGKGYKETSTTVVTQSAPATPTDNTITLTSSGDATAKLTLDGVNIVASGKSAIDVTGKSNAEITVEGENSVTASYANYNDPAAIHVTDGNLTIQGNSDDDKLLASTDTGNSNTTSYGAAIGTNIGEDLNGTVTITGNVDVTARSGEAGAAIGTGNAIYTEDYKVAGNFNGIINITNGANVNAESGSDGAGIGSGDEANFNGTINIEGSTVRAVSGDEAAGIGSGEDGEFTSTGVVNIVDSQVYAEANDDSAGIGSEDDFEGTVLIKNSTVTAIGDGGGAGIGGGDSGYFTGTVIIDGSTVTAEGDDGGAGIGAGDYCDFDGSVTITDSTVIATGEYGSAGIGAGEEGNYTGSVTIKNSNVTAETKDGGAAIGAGIGVNYDDYTYGGNFSGTLDIQDSTVTVSTGTGSNLDSGTSIGTGEQGDFNGNISIGGNTTLRVFNSIHETIIGAATGKSEGIISIGKNVKILLNPVERIYEEKKNENEIDSFWLEVLRQILAVKEGDTITVDAAWRTWIPLYVIEAAEECEVTLVIQWDGGEDITIAPTDEIELEQSTIALKDLAK